MRPVGKMLPALRSNLAVRFFVPHSFAQNANESRHSPGLMPESAFDSYRIPRATVYAGGTM